MRMDLLDPTCRTKSMKLKIGFFILTFGMIAILLLRDFGSGIATEPENLLKSIIATLSHVIIASLIFIERKNLAIFMSIVLR